MDAPIALRKTLARGCENKLEPKRSMRKYLKKILIFFLISRFLISHSQSGFAQESDIIEAAKSGNEEKVKALLGADPELIDTVDSGIGATSSHWASSMAKKRSEKGYPGL